MRTTSPPTSPPSPGCRRRGHVHGAATTPPSTGSDDDPGDHDQADDRRRPHRRRGRLRTGRPGQADLRERRLHQLPHAEGRGRDRDGRTQPRRSEAAEGDTVVDRVTNGKGVMPSFKGQLTPAQIDAVAAYVSTSPASSARHRSASWPRLPWDVGLRTRRFANERLVVLVGLGGGLRALHRARARPRAPLRRHRLQVPGLEPDPGLDPDAARARRLRPLPARDGADPARRRSPRSGCSSCRTRRTSSPTSSISRRRARRRSGSTASSCPPSPGRACCSASSRSTSCTPSPGTVSVAPVGWLGVFGVLALVSAGVYLGRVKRWNSWDLLTQPGAHARAAARPPRRPGFARPGGRRHASR